MTEPIDLGPLQALSGSIPDGLIAGIARALSKNPNDRPRSVREMIALAGLGPTPIAEPLAPAYGPPPNMMVPAYGPPPNMMVPAYGPPPNPITPVPLPNPAPEHLMPAYGPPIAPGIAGWKRAVIGLALLVVLAVGAYLLWSVL